MSIAEFENAVNDAINDKLADVPISEIERYWRDYTVVRWIKRIRRR